MPDSFTMKEQSMGLNTTHLPKETIKHCHQKLHNFPPNHSQSGKSFAG